jgi:hypothetical protein
MSDLIRELMPSISTASGLSNEARDGSHIAGSAKVRPQTSRPRLAPQQDERALSIPDEPQPEFWTNRLACTYPPLETSQTQIPQIPDQTDFVKRWFEFHQGYRIVERADGTEQRIAVIGEPFREVSPGFLPRTLDQLRAGRTNDHTRPENRFRRGRIPEEEDSEETPHQTLEEALDSLLDEVSDEETARHSNETAAQHVEEADMPGRREVTSLSRPLTRAEARIQRARQGFARMFGTREEIEADDYQSPITGMFSRAWERFGQAEARRASGETVAPAVNTLTPVERREIEQQILWGVMRESTEIEEVEDTGRRFFSTLRDNRSEDALLPGEERPPVRIPTPQPGPGMPSRSSIDELTLQLARMRQAYDQQRNAMRPGPTLDSQPNRPPPLKEEQMMKNLQCHVCYAQLADIAVLPCGHMVMCEYCADVVIPVKNQQFPVRPSKCPMCRKGVKQRVRIHFG